MKCIEFIGLPGSGKSTVARNVVDLLKADGQQVLIKPDIMQTAMRKRVEQESGPVWRIARMLTRVWEYRILNLAWEKHRRAYLLRFMLRYPGLARQAIDCAEYVTPPDGISDTILSGENLLSWLFDAACYYQAACEHLSERNIIVLEEAFCQQAYYLLAFHRNGCDVEQLRDYLQAIPTPDLIIALTLSAEACEQRMHGRSKGIASDILTPLTVAQRLSVLEQRLTMYTDIAAYFEQRGVPVLRIANTDYTITQRQLQDALVSSRVFHL